MSFSPRYFDDNDWLVPRYFPFPIEIFEILQRESYLTKSQSLDSNLLKIINANSVIMATEILKRSSHLVKDIDKSSEILNLLANGSPAVLIEQEESRITDSIRKNSATVRQIENNSYRD